MKPLLLASSIAITLLAGCTNIEVEFGPDDVSETVNKSPKNIIMVIGDGMGPAYTTAYRYFKDNPLTSTVELTVFDELLVGMSSTYPDHDEGYITDSAASATALATGHKTYNGAIGVDTKKQELLTLMEKAKKLGKKTGLAVTSQINHATPASYFAHNESRQNYNEIADSYYDDKTQGKFTADVMLGGGQKYFIRDDRNLVEEFKQAGFQYANEYSQLKSLDTSQPILGLFADKGLPWNLDREKHDRLLTLTKTAIKHLENDEGFVLLIEASQIDWAGHANDIASAMSEMNDLAITLEWLKNYVDTRNDTLLVATADHSTGGLSVAANGDYRWEPSILKTMTASPETISKMLVNDKDFLNSDKLTQVLGFELTLEEKQQLAPLTNAKVRTMYKQLKSIVDIRTNTGWTTSGHTGVDVQVFATGVGAEKFAKHQTNTDIAKNLFTFLK